MKKILKMCKNVEKTILFIFSFFFLFFISAQAANIFKIEIQGNKIISDATIFSHIKIKVGQEYNEKVVNEDVKSLMSLGYFEEIVVEKMEVPKGIIVRFKLKEKPVLKKVVIEGNRRIRAKKIKEIMDLKEGVFLDEFKVKEAVRKVEDFYHRRGFSRANVSYDIDVDKDTNQAMLKIIIDERGIAKVRKIIIKGNASFPTKRIKKLMKTKEAGFFRRGIFKKEILEDDITRIKDFYVENGFSDVEIDYSWEYLKRGVYITIKINEGSRYYVGKVSVEGNKDISTEEISKLIELKEGDIFTKRKMEEQALNIQGLYFDKGYIFAQVTPLSYINPKTHKVDIVYRIVEREINYVEEIIIRGNEKTKDKVIRRELRIYPGDKFEGTKIKRSRQRLENLGFFEEIRFDAEPGSRPNWQNLIVEVKEAKTGYLSFGGGYSSVDEFIGFVELRQRNFDFRNWKTFTGAGEDLSLYLSSGTLTENYELSFTHPWIFDYPVSFGFDAYKKEHEREEDVGYGYKVDARGGALRLTREFTDYVKGGITYRLEKVEISDVPSDATNDLKEEEGEVDLSSLELHLSWDRRDNVFNPTEGFYFLNSFQITGGFLGGDRDFMKFFSRFSVYFPLPKKAVLELRLRAGIGAAFSGTEKIPIYERFFAGGASTIRGYHERKVGPIDASTEDPLGGEALFVSNIEYTYPLTDFLKVATFFDTGNVWAKRGDFLSGGLKSSVGIGLRVKTPIGPISVDYGWPLNKEPGEEGKEGRFHFSVSRGF